MTRDDRPRPATGPTVFYDGACPLCRAEINLYRGQAGASDIVFQDVTDRKNALPDGLERDAAKARFHAMTTDGRLVSGFEAFCEVWQHLPGWRVLATIGRQPGARHLGEAAYRVFLKCRPRIVGLYLRLSGGTA